MANNILSAIYGIAQYRKNSIADYASIYKNRINSVGEGLEIYIKDALAGSLGKSQAECESSYHSTFSWRGTQNNPPDVILKHGDAFEVKKIEGRSSALQLNSSPPKNMLHSADPRVTKDCRNCEERPWEKKDLFYVVGSVQNRRINYLFFVHGLCYAADESVYSRIHSPLKKDIGALIKAKGLEGKETIELGNVTKVDPLGITDLRIRGMWIIQNPVQVFKKFSPILPNKEFSLAAIMTEEKYRSFGKAAGSLEADKRVKVTDIKVDNPNNPAKEISAKLLQLWW